jgi:integrase
MKITKSRVDELKTRTTDYIAWDSELKGFGCKVLPSGTKTYVACGRARNKQIAITIGRTTLYSPDQARLRAHKLLIQMADGIDPRAVGKEEAAALTTLRAIALRYVNEKKLKETSKQTILRHIDKTFAKWADMPCAKITRAMISARYDEYRKGGHDGSKPAPGQANQAFQVLKALLNFAMRELRTATDEPIIKENPVGVLHGKWAETEARTRMIEDDKIGEVVDMLLSSRHLPLNAETKTGIDLTLGLLLTGCRLSELTTLKWSQVTLNGEKSSIHLPDPKGKKPIWLPLSTQMQELLAQRPRLNSTDFVFPSWGKSGHLIDPRDTLNKISAICGHRISAHDLRRSYTTYGIANCNIEFIRVELLTGHKPTSVTGRHYLKTDHLEYLYPETQRISDFIYDKMREFRAKA